MKKNKYNYRKTDSKLEPMTQVPLQKKNFVLMIIAACVIVLGFLLMLGPGSTHENFNPDIFSTRRIVVGPTIAFLGFIFMGVAIIYRGKQTPAASEEK